MSTNQIDWNCYDLGDILAESVRPACDSEVWLDAAERLGSCYFCDFAHLGGLRKVRAARLLRRDTELLPADLQNIALQCLTSTDTRADARTHALWWLVVQDINNSDALHREWVEDQQAEFNDEGCDW